MIGILRLREELHNTCLRTRSILTVICKIEFEVLWDNSIDDKKREALQFIEKHDKEGLLNWIKSHPSISTAEMNYRQLADRAKALHIVNYCRLTKVELIAAIDKAMKNAAANEMMKEQ